MGKHGVANEEVAAFFDENLSRSTGMTFYLSMFCIPFWSSVNVFPTQRVQGLKLKRPSQWCLKPRVTKSTQLSYLNWILEIWDTIWYFTTCWESVKFIFHHFHHFVKVQVLIKPYERIHHYHTFFSGTPCKLLLPGPEGTFTMLDLGPIPRLPPPEPPSLSWNSFGINLIPWISWIQTAPCLSL